jgi:hypothetical protein
LFQIKQNSSFVAISNLGDTVIDITRNTLEVSINWKYKHQICEKKIKDKTQKLGATNLEM